MKEGLTIQGFEKLKTRLQDIQIPISIAVVCAEEEHIFAALQKAGEAISIRAVLIGNTEKMHQLAQTYDLSALSVELAAASSPREAARKAVALARAGEIDVLMKGSIQTADLLREVVDKENGIGLGGVMSHIALEEIPSYHKLFAITDSGMLLYPTLEQKKELIKNAVRLYHALGEPCPKVAVLAAAEVVNPKVPASVEARELALWQRAGGIQGCIIEGPMSYDLAMDPCSVAQKGYQSEVAADADILVVPDLISGNLLGKALVFSGKARMAGLISGAKVPIVLTSRGSSEDEKYLSILLAALAASEK